MTLSEKWSVVSVTPCVCDCTGDS